MFFYFEYPNRNYICSDASPRFYFSILEIVSAFTTGIRSRCLFVIQWSISYPNNVNVCLYLCKICLDINQFAFLHWHIVYVHRNREIQCYGSHQINSWFERFLKGFYIEFSKNCILTWAFVNWDFAYVYKVILNEFRWVF